MPEADGFGCVIDQVVEVERVFGAEQVLVALPDALEEIEEGGAAHGVGELSGTGAQLRHRQSGGFDQTEEGGEQLSEPGGDNAAQVAEQGRDGRPLELHTVGAEVALERGQQRVVALLPAVGFDQCGAVFLVQVALPEDALAVVRPAGGGLAVGVEREMFDVDVVVGQIDVGLVLAMAGIGGVDAIGRFVLEFDAVEGEEVGDFELFVALDLIAAQGAQFDAADVAAVIGEAVEVERRLVGLGMVGGELSEGVGVGRRGDQFVDDLIECLASCEAVFGEP